MAKQKSLEDAIVKDGYYVWPDGTKVKTSEINDYLKGNASSSNSNNSPGEGLRLSKDKKFWILPDGRKIPVNDKEALDKYFNNTKQEPKQEPKQDPPRQEPRQEPRQDPPRPRQTPQQKAGLPKSVPAALVPDVVKYQKARQKAVTSGNQKQMDKVRNDGMAIWAKLYGPGGKKELKYPTARQKEIFKQHSSNTTNQGSSSSLTSSQKGEILKRGAEARQSIEKEAQKRGIPKMDDKKLLGKVGAEVKFESTNIAKEPYDLILEYLLEKGHADTIDEANYIMLKLDSQSIQTIVENVQGGPILPGEKGKKVYPKGKEPKPTGAELPKV